MTSPTRSADRAPASPSTSRGRRFTINSATPSQGRAHAGNTIACTWDASPPASATVTATITPNAPGVDQPRHDQPGEFDISLANNTSTSRPSSSPARWPRPSSPRRSPRRRARPACGQRPHAAGHTTPGRSPAAPSPAARARARSRSPRARPGTTMRLSVVDSVAGCDSAPGRRNVQVHFLDVPPAHVFHTHVNTLARNQVTGGCGGGNYCPDVSIPREQMAVFLLVAKEGAGYAPPACTTPMFNDVPCSSPFARVDQRAGPARRDRRLRRRELLPRRPRSPASRCRSSCSSPRRGPATTRPPARRRPSATCRAAAPSRGGSRSSRGARITGGCGGGNYCPLAPNTRGEMAVFIVTTFGLN